MSTQSTTGSAAEHPGPAQLQLVTFEIESEEFAIDILSVQEIIRMIPITRVPQSPPELEGVINLRGRIIPVISLRRRFNMPSKPVDPDTRTVVVEVAGRMIGFIVDSVHEVHRISSTIVEPPPTMIISGKSNDIAGVAKLEDRLLIMLDVQRLVHSELLHAADQIVEQAAA